MSAVSQKMEQKELQVRALDEISHQKHICKECSNGNHEFHDIRSMYRLGCQNKPLTSFACECVETSGPGLQPEDKSSL